MSGYNFFYQQQHKTLHTCDNYQFKELPKRISQLWREIDEKEKLRYNQMGLQDVQRYREEIQKKKDALLRVEI